MFCTSCSLLGGLVQDIHNVKEGALDHIVYQAGDIIFSEGAPCEGLYCVQDGAVMMGRVSAANQWVPLAFAKGPYLLGASGIPSGVHPHTAQALTDLNVCRLNLDALNGADGTMNPKARWKLMQKIMEELGWAENRLGVAPQANNSEKLQIILQPMVKALGMEARGKVQLPISQDMLAAWVGCSKRALHKHLMELDDMVVQFAR